MEPTTKLRAFLLLRYTLIIATAYLLLAEGSFGAPSALAGVLLAVALTSNLVAAQLPRWIADTPRFALAVIVYDTAWVTAAMMASGRFNADFYMLYFFILLLAAIGQSVRLIAIGAGVVCAAYLVGHSTIGGGWDMWTSPSLIRVPFLFTTAIFYGYLVERTRYESERADSAEALAAQLARTLTEFKLLYARTQEAERIKTEFLAAVSHELRTPLASLMGYVDLLLDDSFGRVSPDQRGALGKVRTSSRILQQAIARMLDASRLDNGHERVRCDEFELEAILDDLRDLHPAPGVTVQWPAADALPVLRTDADKLSTILRNLLENAYKHTERGFVRVDARWLRDRDEIELAVVDSGNGIAAAELEAIFEPFRQGSNRSDPLHTGIGLGLYIAQRLVDRLGGIITVESQLGMGSTFTVRLPRLVHRGDAVVAAEPSAAA